MKTQWFGGDDDDDDKATPPGESEAIPETGDYHLNDEDGTRIGETDTSDNLGL